MGRPSTTGAKGVVARQTAAGVAYRIVYKGPEGERVFEPAGTDKRAAAKMLAERKAAVLRGDWRPLAEVRAATGTASGEQTVRSYAETWHERRVKNGVRTADSEWQRMRDYVLPRIGDRLLADVKRADIVKLVAAVTRAPRVDEKRKSKIAAPLSPRSVHRVYEATRGMFADAVVDELVPANPCTLRASRKELPVNDDADPTWRATAVFTRDEVEALISDDRVALQRRVTYALAFLTGMRIGEVLGRRWREYDPETQPLGRLLVPTQYDGQALKTKRPREVPVHPTLAAILAEWKLSGFPVLHGHPPTGDDFIVPGRTGKAQAHGLIWEQMQADLERLGIRPRRVHDMRRSFISLAMSGGARKDYLKRVTHGGRGDVFDEYNTASWADLCAAVSCLRAERRGVAKVTSIKRVG